MRRCGASTALGPGLAKAQRRVVVVVVGGVDSSLIWGICRPRVRIRKGEGRGLSQREDRFMK